MGIEEWVKAARQHKGWTQQQLADKVARTKANVSGWENGLHEPSIAQLLLVASLTGYPFALLAWPFDRVDADRYTKLGEEDRAYVQGQMMAAIIERERATNVVPITNGAPPPPLKRGIPSPPSTRLRLAKSTKKSPTIRRGVTKK